MSDRSRESGQGASEASDVLSVNGLSRRFGQVVAMDDITFGCRSDERVALIGPNGAGKTTLINAITGFVEPDAGTIEINGHDLARLPAWRRTSLGLCRTFQTARVFDGLTVEENLVIAHLARSTSIGGFASRRSAEMRDEAHHLAERASLANLLKVKAGDLSHGERRRLELGMVSARSPKLILLDEPTAGIEIDGRDEMMGFVIALADEIDSALLFTEHDMDVVFSFASRVLVLVGGVVIFDGTCSDAATDRRVQEAYLDAG